MFLNKEKESGVTFNPSWVKRLTAFEQLGPEVLKFSLNLKARLIGPAKVTNLFAQYFD